MLKPILFSIGLSLSVSALANLENKGIEVCQHGNADNCIVTNINKPVPASDAGKKPANANAKSETNSADSLPEDVNIQFKYSDASGNGKAKLLNNKQTLRSGDKFTIEIEVKQDVYLYLFHFDAHKQLNELVSLTSPYKDNHLKAGTKFTLPSDTQHYKLDDKIGTETIHTIISTEPLNNLLAKYIQKVQGKPVEQAQTVATMAQQGGEASVTQIAAKGIVVEDDQRAEAAKTDSAGSNKTASSVTSSNSNTGRTVVCLAAETSACRDSFEINHVK